MYMIVKKRFCAKQPMASNLWQARAKYICQGNNYRHLLKHCIFQCQLDQEKNKSCRLKEWMIKVMMDQHKNVGL